MSAITAIPVSITPDASAQVAKLGMQTQLEQMIEHTRNNVLGLRCIEVFLEQRYDEPGEEPGVTIEAIRQAPRSANDSTRNELREWKLTTFPPDVCRHFVIRIHNETSDAR